jgi:hypothetical protein
VTQYHCDFETQISADTPVRGKVEPVGVPLDVFSCFALQKRRIIELHGQLGDDWTQIAKMLEGAQVETSETTGELCVLLTPLNGHMPSALLTGFCICMSVVPISWIGRWAIETLCVAGAFLLSVVVQS